LILKTFELISVVLSAFVAGVFWGPWVGLTRLIRTFQPDFFLAIVHRLNLNLGPVMTILMPAALLSIGPLLLFSFHQPETFYFTLAAFVLFFIALLVTVIVEVPIVQQIDKWTVSTRPANWQQLRDRWGSFHITRVAASFAGLALLVAGAIF
jgi:uncharacterized membrane protein